VKLLRELERHLETCPELSRTLDAALVMEPATDPREGGVIREGFDSRLDELVKQPDPASNGSFASRPMK